MSYRHLKPYFVSILILLSGLPLGFTAGGLFALAALMLAAASFLHTRLLLSELERVEQQRRMLDEQLCRAQKLFAVDELSSGIAHEINNPLGIIAQETQWIEHVLKGDALKDLKDTEDCKDSLGEINRQVDRCKEIVQKLLSLAREMEPVIQCVDVNDLIENMTDIVERETAGKKITITRQLQHNLPLVDTDPPLLRQVVLNLLVNATHAVEEGGTICIMTNATENNSVDIVVQDNGCGIPEENLTRIFTPFFSTKPQGKGTGLGLAICRGIIERLGGHISVSSDVGKHTAFTIRLPVGRRLQGEK